MAVDLNNVNYILLKADGSVLTQKMEYYIQQGSIGDKIFFGSAAAQNTDIGIAVCTLPNGEQTTLQGTWDTCTYEGSVIGGFVFTLGSAETNYNGGLMMALAIYRSNVRLVNYPLYAVINETGLRSDTNTGVTVEEINSYLRYIQGFTSVEDSILVVDDIQTIVDWSAFSNGQVFFDRATNLYYEKISTSPYYSEYKQGLLASERTILRFTGWNEEVILSELYNLANTRLTIFQIEGIEYLIKMNNDHSLIAYDFANKCWYEYNGLSYDEWSDVLSNDNKQIIATKEDIENLGNLFDFKGAASVAEINALTDIGNAWAYNLTDSGTLTLGNLQVETGDNVAFNGSVWIKLSSETVLGQYYTKQQGQAFETQVDNRVDAIENQVQQVAQGSPKGVYATLGDLQTAYPTGAEGIYVVSADGHWYYWNDSAWTDGGVYQSAVGVVPETRTIAGLSLESDITKEQLQSALNIIQFFKAYIGNKTLYNKYTTIFDGYFFLAATGELYQGTVAEQWGHNDDYFEVEANSVLKFNGECVIIQYNANKEYISGNYYANASGGTVGIQSTAKYIRISIKQPINDTFYIMKNSDWSDTYVPFYYEIDERKVKVNFYNKDEKIKYGEVDFLSFDEDNTVNLFDKNSTILANSYVNFSGEIAVNSGFKLTDYIKVNESSGIAINTAAGSSIIAFYDENKTWISTQGNVGRYVIIRTPVNCAYVRIAIPSAFDVSTFMVINGTNADIPSEYVPAYYYYTKNMPELTLLKPSYKHFDGMLKCKTNGNIFDRNDKGIKYYRWINLSGVITEYDNFCYTDYFEIDEKTPWTSSVNTIIAYYDENKDFISGEGNRRTSTTPAGTKYARLSIVTNDNGGLDAFAFSIGSGTLANTYMPDGKPDGFRYELDRKKISFGNIIHFRSKLKIICIGDSLTQGEGPDSDTGKNYPYYLSKFLDAEVINYGKSGRHVDYFVEHKNDFNFVGDVVLIMLGTNGGIPDTMETSVEFNDQQTASADIKTSPEDYANDNLGNYCRLIEHILSVNNYNVQIVLVTPPYNYYSYNRYQEVLGCSIVIPKIAKRYSIPYIDVFNESGMNAWNGSIYRPVDNMHFNALGYQKLATFIGSKLKSLLQIDIKDSEL